MSKAIIAAFVATSAVALEVKPMYSGRDHDNGRVATSHARPTTSQGAKAGTSTGHRGVPTKNVVA